MMRITSLFLLLIFVAPGLYGQENKSTATLRLEEYDQNNSCELSIPDNPEWNIAFDRTKLQGDLAPDVTYTRRDPSSVLKVNGEYFVWYSYSLTDGAGKNAPWDLNDLYYATSADGYSWHEQGPAVQRGPAGSYDHRSAFTTEVFYHDSTFYLVYQAAADIEGIYGNNTIAMAYAGSPHGPWTKLEELLLYPSEADEPVFDDRAVHDPCLIYFKDKFYLYYKGEGSETPICGIGVWGLDKQVKWGVAVSDKPTGPFVKSTYNPVTNTGHEVCVWNSGEGIAIMLYQDGPEYGTIQYAEDGLNFEIMGEVKDFELTDYSSDFPEAAGVYRPVSEELSPISGVSWGLCHVLTREQGKYWMYLLRFENEDKQFVIDDADNNGIELELDTPAGTSLKTKNQIRVYPNPVTDRIYIEHIEPGLYAFEVLSELGQLIQTGIYDTHTGVLDLVDLEEGFYVLHLVHVESRENYRVRFVKSRGK